ncbi:PQQ-dependent sugar dehydrogenase [Sneathiella limimaris]|uniref:PQQ-dependent sugar dehydrogenase n=1 Tax=Sneathiella limimaris TaxID=1964213 RepID=UPI0019D120E2
MNKNSKNRLQRTALSFLGVFTITFSPALAVSSDFNDRAPNAPHQTPAFEGQTRAPIIDDAIAITETTIASGFVNPWGVDQLPDGGWLVTERPGRLRHVSRNGDVSKPITGLPDVDARGQGGLLDILISPNFSDDRRIWWSYAEPRGNGVNGTAVATGQLSNDLTKVQNVKVIFSQQPGWRSTYHFGSRLVLDTKGALFVTTGERSYVNARKMAQDPMTHIGKVIRLNPLGGAADDNPIIPNALPEVWSWGHRNIQAAALSPDGQLWTIEHGPRGGDELNRPEAGKNYGWPIITYGEDYSGTPIGAGITAKEGMEQPIYYWDPVIAPSGMTFYNGELFKDWKGSILVGGLASRSLIRLTLERDRVTGEARYRQGKARVRDVDVADDGSVILLTDANNGSLIRLTPDQ